MQLEHRLADFVFSLAPELSRWPLYVLHVPASYPTPHGCAAFVPNGTDFALRAAMLDAGLWPEPLGVPQDEHARSPKGWAQGQAAQQEAHGGQRMAGHAARGPVQRFGPPRRQHVAQKFFCCFDLPIGVPALGLQVDRDEPMHVGVRQIQGEPAGLTRPAGFPVLDRRFTDQALSQPQGDALLADPRRPLEQEGLG